MDEIHLLTINFILKKRNWFQRRILQLPHNKEQYTLWLLVREIRVFELKRMGMNLAVFSATLVGEKGLSGDSNPDLCDADAVLYQLSY